MSRVPYKNSLSRRALMLLESRGPVSFKTMRLVLGANQSSILTALGRLEKQGLISSQPKIYELTTNGQAVLAEKDTP